MTVTMSLLGWPTIQPMNRLEEIIAVKKREVERLRPRARELQKAATTSPVSSRRFRTALQRKDDQLSIIAEIKRSSPSAGLIAASFDPVQRAKNYERAGAE